jgi:hypothetical protein
MRPFAIKPISSAMLNASCWSCVTRIGGGFLLFQYVAYFEAQALAHFHVEIRKRLVEQEQLRTRRERACKSDALLLSARELLRIARCHRLQADRFEELGYACCARRLRYAA